MNLVVRRLAMSGTLALVSALLPSVSTTPGAAAAVTCAGETATVVGAPDRERLVGTAGRDVVVTNGSRVTETLAGDDLVCVSSAGPAVSTQVRAGAGDDVVRVEPDSSPRQDYTIDVDDDPADNGTDVVTGGAGSTLVRSNGGADRIDAGTGRSSVFVGQPAIPFAGEITVGVVGRVIVRGPLRGARLAVRGTAGLEIDSRLALPGAWAIDAHSGRVAYAGQVVLEWTGRVSGFGWEGRTVSLVGSDQADYLEAGTVRSIALAGGDDFVRARTTTMPVGLDGGAGRDMFLLVPDHVRAYPMDRIDADLRSHRFSIDGARPVPLTGFEEVGLSGARHTTLVGDGADNDLGAGGCRTRILGLGGDDEVRSFSTLAEGRACRRPDRRAFGGAGDDRVLGGSAFDRLYGGPGDDLFRTGGWFVVHGGPGDDEVHGTFQRRPVTRDVIHGDAGDDLLYGGRGPDLVVGGPGRDRSVGGLGLDTCRAEVRRTCERR